jgi:hypothetical protein
LSKLFIIGLTYLFVWPSILCLGLTIFRFKLRPLLVPLAFSTVILTNISVWVQSTQMIYLLTLIQFISSATCCWLLFKISLRHSLFMMLITHLACFAIEALVTAVVPQMFIQFVSEDNMMRFFYMGVLYSIVLWLVIGLLKNLRLGFSLIPQSKLNRHLRFRGSALFRIALFSGFCASLAISLSYFLYPKGLVPVVTSLIIILSLLFRISYEWEMKE